MKKKFRRNIFVRFLVSGLTVSGLLSMPAMAEPKAADAYEVKVETGYLALRSGPAYDSGNELEPLYTGDLFYVMDDSDSTYAYGYSESGKMGYVNKNYLVNAYNIASGIRTSASQGLSCLETDHFCIYLPGDIAWEYEVVDNSTIGIYYTPSKEAGYGGHVVSIRAYDWGDNEYEDFPSWSIAGLNDEKKFVAIYPTDVQFDPDDSFQADGYRRLLSTAEHMDCNDEEMAKANPFEVK